MVIGGMQRWACEENPVAKSYLRYLVAYVSVEKTRMQTDLFPAVAPARTGKSFLRASNFPRSVSAATAGFARVMGGLADVIPIALPFYLVA